ncbi:hypothetical protein [Caenimonas koreensis]|uniref:hypothetical protein n=1 Tax=Caenimonas koreensis TaxID=367474 RepID=UPI00378302F0
MPNAPQFPGLPLRRDTAEDTSGLQAFGWLAVLLGGFAVVVLIVARGKRHATPAKLAGVAAPAVTGRTALASNVTVYTLKWGNEELLVGNTSGSLTLLARRPCEAGALAGEARAAR